MSRVESVSLAVSPIVGQCACRHVSESNKQRNAGHRTVGRMERTVLWSVVIAGSFLVIGCLVLEVITRKQMKVLAERCLTHHGGVHTPQKNHVDVTPTKNSFANSEKQIDDMTPLDDDANSTPRTWKRHPSRKRARALRTQSSQSPTRASHFVANNDRSNDFQYSDESCIPKWDGMFCRNGTYWSDRTAQIIKFFVGSDWTRNNDFGIQSALNQSTPGMFRVQGGGLYLIYINVMIRTTEDKHDIEIYSDNTRLLRCRQGLDYVRQTTDRYLYSKTRTCSVMGLFYLEDGAVLTSRILQARTTLSLGPDSTNFGAILFTSHPQLDDFSYFG
ncbi:uncharacterized protein LOC117342197 [Pecten maximus]|uniref:uncharacterized protein LOC117342197 n=1 Tax=Pecten maximus TaxID=6579 RepID=UPI0014591931|nr:uncharacterized protein LOC117342197 [Pecten maximus]